MLKPRMDSPWTPPYSLQVIRWQTWWRISPGASTVALVLCILKCCASSMQWSREALKWLQEVRDSCFYANWRRWGTCTMMYKKVNSMKRQVRVSGLWRRAYWQAFWSSTWNGLLCRLRQLKRLDIRYTARALKLANIIGLPNLREIHIYCTGKVDEAFLVKVSIIAWRTRFSVFTTAAYLLSVSSSSDCNDLMHLQNMVQWNL